MSNSAEKTSLFSVFSNLFMVLIKLITGILGNSFALIADAIESASDVLSSLLVFFGLKYSSKPADEDHPYGHGRIEPLLTFVVVGFLIISALLIGYQSIQNIIHPDGVIPEPFTLILLGIIIVWKEISFRLVNKKSKELGSTALEADAWHHRSDAITSFAAFVGIGLTIVLGKEWATADDWAALVAALFILYNAYKIFRPALGEIMDENVYQHEIDEIREIASNVYGVLGTEKCIVRKTGLQYHVDLHALVDGSISVKKGHDIAHDIINTLKKVMPNLGHINIHIEPYDVNYLNKN